MRAITSEYVRFARASAGYPDGPGPIRRDGAAVAPASGGAFGFGPDVGSGSYATSA